MGFLNEAVDTLVSVFEGGPDNWRDRLNNDLILISPEGTEYRPVYLDQDGFQLQKRLGMFDFPLVRGTVVQDLDTSSLWISMRFFFEGKNNDVNARAFLSSCKERGPWSVNHPVHGEYELQLVSVVLVNSNDGLTELSTEWIEPLDPEYLLTARELAGIVDSQISDLNTGALSQFVDDIQQTTATLKHIVETTTEGIQNVVDYTLYPLFGVVDAVDDAMTTIAVGIQDSLSAVLLPLAELGGQIQNLIEIPALAMRDLSTRMDSYESLTTGLNELLPGESATPLPYTAQSQTKINNIATTELGLTSAVCAFARIAITADLYSREQAIDTAEKIAEQFSDMVAILEEKQADFETLHIDKQYFSQSSTFNDCIKLISYTQQYLLRKSFDLKIKQIITLDRPSFPVDLAAEYYGDFEEINFFSDTNELEGNEIFLLPAGREIVIYV